MVFTALEDEQRPPPPKKPSNFDLQEILRPWFEEVGEGGGGVRRNVHYTSHH
jgi:hypothetical protein